MSIHRPMQELRGPRSVDEGTLSERKRVVQWLENILTISHEDALDLSHRAPDEFDAVQIACTKISCEYTQWSRNLSLELPLQYFNGFDPSPDSTLKNCGPLDTSAEEQRRLAALRVMFIQNLIEILPLGEREAHANLLAIRSFEGGLSDDAGALATVSLVEQCFHARYAELENLEMNKDIYAGGRTLAPCVVSDLSVLVSTQIGNVLRAVKQDHANGNSDSLPARLILNASINRAVLEIDEFARLHNQVVADLKEVIGLLACVLPQGPINVQSGDEIFSVILKAFSVDPSDLVHPENWRQLTESEKPLILQRSAQLREQFCLTRSSGRVAEFRNIHGNPHNNLLAAACFAWAYCTRSVHDLRVPGMKHRTVSIIHSRSNAEDSNMPHSMVANLMRQYGLLFYSNQHLHRSRLALNDYSTAAQVKRHMLRRLFVYELKDASLEQWQAITKWLAIAGDQGWKW